MARGKNSLIQPIDLTGFESWLEQLGDTAEKTVRPAAQAGAQVLYDAVKNNVAGIKRHSGNLAKAIYQAYSENNSIPLRKATYHVSWNAVTAPHGGLLEYGYWQRYEYYQDANGEVKIKVRPGMEGRPWPKKRDSRTYKDAYFVARDGGPVYVPGKAFMRRALATHSSQAIDAAGKVVLEALERVK